MGKKWNFWHVEQLSIAFEDCARQDNIGIEKDIIGLSSCMHSHAQAAEAFEGIGADCPAAALLTPNVRGSYFRLCKGSHAGMWLYLQPWL